MALVDDFNSIRLHKENLNGKLPDTLTPLVRLFWEKSGELAYKNIGMKVQSYESLPTDWKAHMTELTAWLKEKGFHE